MNGKSISKFSRSNKSHVWSLNKPVDKKLYLRLRLSLELMSFGILCERRTISMRGKTHTHTASCMQLKFFIYTTNGYGWQRTDLLPLIWYVFFKIEVFRREHNQIFDCHNSSRCWLRQAIRCKAWCQITLMNAIPARAISTDSAKVNICTHISWDWMSSSSAKPI